MNKPPLVPIKFARVNLTATFLSVLSLMLPLTDGRCAQPSYPAVVLSDGALGYYRFNDSLTRSNVNVNSSSLGAAGNVTNTIASATTDSVRAFPGALAGDGNRSQFYDSIAYGMIPYNAALNPDNTHPFTIEAWFYPASDQINGGQCPLNNRLAGSATDRTGWVFFQRAPDLTYSGLSGYEGVGWNCRMYNGIGTGGKLDVTSQVPYQVGKWTHVVVVYDPVNVIDATLTMYIDGVAANTNIWTGGAGTDPGYVGNASGSDVALSFGAYNNTSGAGSNPYFGAVDEFAYYATKLSPAQILAHYQNATNANRATPYAALIQSDNPVVYLRLDELNPGADMAINLGDVQAAGNATFTSAIKHPGASALAGRTGDGSLSGHYRDTDSSGHAYANIPWNAANNPDASVPFTFEGWFRPTGDQQNPGPSPVNNRLANGIANRTGWVIYQRDPNDTYKGPPAVPGESGVGWTFRMYTGTGTGGQDVLTGVPYTMGAWTHLVVTWQPQTDISPAGNGNVAWQGVLTAYVDGTAVASNSFANYSANANPTEDLRAPADFAVGSYNAASGLGEEFEGDIDEIAFYNNYVLTPDQILAHYQAGTNSHPATNYETLVLTAAYDGQPTTPQRTMPKTYLRFNEPAYFPAANSGSLGYQANGSLVMTTNVGAGPTAPDFVDFESPNPAATFSGTNSWISLNNPPGLNLSGQIALEAWIKPDATQGTTARIVSHGPPTATVYDLGTYPITLDGSLLNSNEVFLRIEGNGATYSIGRTDGVTFHGATAAVPAGDLGGANGWIYLVGTYDGTNWNLFRNGLQIASGADQGGGAVAVADGEWAIGATGMGWADFFTGGIDEVAIYDPALTPARVWAHYYLAKHGRAGVTLTITRVAGVTTVSWPAGTLQEADNLTGPWTDLVGAVGASTYNPPAGPVKKFYRVKL